MALRPELSFGDMVLAGHRPVRLASCLPEPQAPESTKAWDYTCFPKSHLTRLVPSVHPPWVYADDVFELFKWACSFFFDLTAQHVWSQFPDQGSNPCPCTGKSNLNHWTARKVPYCCSCSVAQSCLTLCKPMVCSRPAYLSMGFPRQEYWSGLPFLPAGDLPNPGIQPRSPALAGRFHTTEPPRKPRKVPGHVLLQGFWPLCVGVPGGRGRSRCSWEHRASASLR